jgi:hypothetical protein
VPRNEERRPIEVHQPNASDWEEIARSLHLPIEATTLLRQLVDQIVAKIQSHAELSETIKRGRNRRQQLAHIRRLSRLFTHLEEVLDDRDLNTDRIIRRLLASDLGGFLSLRGISRLGKTSINPSVSDRIRTSRAATSRAGPYEAFENEIASQRRAVAEDIAPKLLLELVRALNAQLTRFLEVQRANKGGAPGLLYRNYVVDELASFFHTVLKKKPTPTPTGKFVLLCELIVTAIGLDGTGIERAVQRRLVAAKR